MAYYIICTHHDIVYKSKGHSTAAAAVIEYAIFCILKYIITYSILKILKKRFKLIIYYFQNQFFRIEQQVGTCLYIIERTKSGDLHCVNWYYYIILYCVLCCLNLSRKNIILYTMRTNKARSPKKIQTPIRVCLVFFQSGRIGRCNIIILIK